MNNQRLRELRAGRRVSLEKLGQVIGKSKVSYVKKENGNVKFQPDEIIALTDFYGLPYDEMNAIFCDGNLPNGNIDDLKTILSGMGII